MFIFQEYGFRNNGKPITRQEDSTFHRDYSVAQPVAYALERREGILRINRRPEEKIESLTYAANARIRAAGSRPFIEPFVSDFTGPNKKEYRYDLAVKGWQEVGNTYAQGVATQLGYQNEFGKFVFTNISNKTFELLGRLSADRIVPALLGDEGQKTMIRSNAPCEDKIDFLLKLRKATANPETKAQGQSPAPEIKAIDQLIDGQLQYIDNNYKADGAIREMSKNRYIKWIMEQMK